MSGRIEFIIQKDVKQRMLGLVLDARPLSCVISDAGRRWGAIRAMLRQKYKYKIRNTNTKICREEMGCNQSYVETTEMEVAPRFKLLTLC